MTTTYTQPEAMIFDMDGTLFQTETMLVGAYHKTFDALRREGLFEGNTPPIDLMLNSLGMLLAAIWERVMPDSSKAVHLRADDLLLEYEMEGLREGDGSLYPGVEQTLRELKARGVRLFVASNGLEPYVKGVAAATGITPLFEGIYSAGEYKTKSKVDLVRILMETHGVQSAWMVGDRSSDVEAGHANGLTVVGCDYAAFRSEGELDEAHIRIASFDELLGYLPTVRA